MDQHLRLHPPICAALAAWCLTASAMAVEDSAAATALAQLSAANTARTELARSEADWKIEKERLLAMIAATQAEQRRLENDATIAEKNHADAIQATAAISDNSDLATTRAKLLAMGVRIRNGLATIARSVPPGTIATVASDTSDDELFDAAIRALDASERASETISVEVVTGQRDGNTEAVKMLRVAGAAAWWVSLNGQSAGVASMVDGVLQLRLAPHPQDQKAIHAALAQAEGRGQPSVVVVPR